MSKPLYDMTISEMHDTCMAVYETLAVATRNMSDAKIVALSAEQALDNLIDKAMVENIIVGKNEREREASTHALFPDQFEALANAKLQALRCDAELQQARLEEQKLTLSVKIFALALSTPE